jgi:hypothetical protein
METAKTPKKKSFFLKIHTSHSPQASAWGPGDTSERNRFNGFHFSEAEMSLGNR